MKDLGRYSKPWFRALQVMWRNGFLRKIEQWTWPMSSFYCQIVGLFDDFFRVECAEGAVKLWKIFKICPRFGKKWRKALFNFPQSNPFLGWFRAYPKIQFQVPDPSLALWTLDTLCIVDDVSKNLAPNEAKSILQTLKLFWVSLIYIFGNYYRGRGSIRYLSK